MERVPQIGLLLVFSPAVAAAICATASFIWPLFNRAYSQGSTTFAALRALHNAAMTVLMLLAAGAAYTAAGGRYPLASVELTDLWPLAAMAIVAQAVNTGVMTLFFLFDRRDVRSVLKPAYVLSDFVFVPAGVLAALLYNAGQPSLFALFAVVMLVFVLSFNSIGVAATGLVLPLASPAFLLGYVAVTLALSSLSYRAFEVPAQRWIRRRMLPARASA